MVSLNHLHINVPDVAKAEAFYKKYFGFQLEFTQGEGVFLRDSGDFLLAIDPLKPGEKPVELPEWFHLGFCFTQPAQVRNLFHEMKKDGVEFASELKEYEEEAVVFFCRAPGQYKIEVSWHRGE